MVYNSELVLDNKFYGAFVRDILLVKIWYFFHLNQQVVDRTYNETASLLTTNSWQRLSYSNYHHWNGII